MSHKQIRAQLYLLSFATGKGSIPTLCPTQLGNVIVAPRKPHTLQRELLLITSPDASFP